MSKVFRTVFASLLLLSLAACRGKPESLRSDPFHSDITGGQLEWVYWPGKKGSTAMWLMPLESETPLITMTCVKDGWKLNIRGYAFQGYQGQNGPVMFMDVEGGGAKLHSRLSWAPTGDTPIARGDMRVTLKDLQALASARTLTFEVADEKQVFNGFGKAGAKFPAECAKSLGVS